MQDETKQTTEKTRKETRSRGTEGRRRPYVRPRLREWGTIVDLTRAGQTEPGDDFRFGSVGGPPGGDG